MSSGTNPTKTAALAQNQKAIEGVDKYLSHVKTLTFGGTDYTPTAIKGLLQAEVDANTVADQGKAQYRQQVVAAKLARSKGRTMRKQLKTYILNSFGADAVQALEGFGFNAPKAAGPKTTEAKAEASAKAKATRAKRKAALASIDAPAPSVSTPAAQVTPPKS